MMKPLNSVLSFVVTFVIVYIVLLLIKPKFVMKTNKKGVSEFNMGMALLWSLIIALIVGVIFMLVGGKKKSGFRYCSME